LHATSFLAPVASEVIPSVQTNNVLISLAGLWNSSMHNLSLSIDTNVHGRQACKVSPRLWTRALATEQLQFHGVVETWRQWRIYMEAGGLQPP
jgi:hypothetical protein